MVQSVQQWLPPALILVMAGLSLWVALLIAARVRRTHEPLRPDAEVAGVMAVIWFFDTLGIGSFAPSTAYYKLRKLVPDYLIPATLLVASSLPGPLQAALIIGIIKVDPVLLVLCIGAAMLGAVAGAKMVRRIPPAKVRLVMAIGLILAAVAMTLGNLHLMPAGGHATSLPPAATAIAMIASFLFASLMNLGIGFYAPTLITLSLLGLDPQAAFPIMIGAVTCLCPSAAIPLVKRREIDLRIVIATAIGAVPGILIAALLVRSMPLEILRWLVVVVVLYAASTLIRSSAQAENEPLDTPLPENS